MSLTWEGPTRIDATDSTDQEKARETERRKKDALALTRPGADPRDQEKRREYLGGSDMAAVMGLDPWRTALDVFEEKIGLTPAQEDNLDLERGRRLEAWAIEKYEQEQEVKVITQPGEYKDGCLAGHPDGLVIHNTLPVGGLEVKCPRTHGWLKAKRDGATPYMIIQGQTYLFLTAWPWIDFAVFNSEHGLLAFRMKYDKELTAKIKEAADLFWNEHVLPGIPPPEPSTDDLELPEVGGDVHLVNSQSWTEHLERLRMAKELRDEAELVWTAARDAVAQGMRTLDVDVLEGAGVRVYNREQPGRKTLDKKLLRRAYPDLDLDQYMKAGKPFRTFRHYLTGGG